MWLLNTETFNLHYFVDKHTRPKYAILSHRWAAQEVTFRHLVEVNKVFWSAEETEDEHEKMLSELHQFSFLSELQEFRVRQLEVMKGWIKVKDFCRKARSLGHSWAWSDTCCIDKSSSAELQEAVNSMYAWYMNSAICLAYLSDVASTEVPRDRDMTQFRNSKWFTRGWTLQELLAPETVFFYDCEWAAIGERRQLEPEIHRATNLPVRFISFKECLKADFAEKMSWIADRYTTREEDLVYCMIGLFQINMPLIYGEGIEMAFLRFQTEYLKIHRDDSMFVWEGAGNTSFGREEAPHMGLLASTPRLFSKTRVGSNMNFSRQSGVFLSTFRSYDWNISREGTLITAYFKYHIHPNRPIVPEALRSSYRSFRLSPLLQASEGRVIYMLLGQRKDALDALTFDRVGPLFEAPRDKFLVANQRPSQITIVCSKYTDIKFQ